MDKRLVVDEKIFQGIEDGTRAYRGPDTVQIDLTDKCNNNCLCCWVHSPRLNKREIFPQGEKELPFELVNRLIDDLHRIGVKDIMLAGSGEVFLHPNIIEIIELIKFHEMDLNIITNGILLNEKISELLVKKKVDLITVSVWAGTPSVYKDLHPGKDERTFERIKENLKKITYYKKYFNSLLPRIKIYNVICSKNYYNIEAMIDFAAEVQAETIEFKIADIIKQKTEDLALSETDLIETARQFKNICSNKKHVFFGTQENDTKELKDQESPLTFNIGKIWSDYKEGFEVTKNAGSLTCRKGHKISKGTEKVIIFKEIAGVSTYPSTVWYKFKCGKSDKCECAKDCLQDGYVSVKFLDIFGVDNFLRRNASSKHENGICEKDIVLKPCTVGWYYARVLSNGNVVPCCKASGHSLGNVYNDLFSTIWYSGAYNEFRDKAKNLPKTNPYFSKINCLKGCDNWWMTAFFENEFSKFKEHMTIMNIIEENKSVTILAKDFVTGTFTSGDPEFGEDLISNKGYALYEFDIEEDGDYELYARYAGRRERPVDLFIDKVLIKKSGSNNITKEWTYWGLRWNKELEINLTKGKHLFEVASTRYIPHIERFVFIKKDKTRDSFNKKDNDYSIRENIDSAEIIWAENSIRGNLNICSFPFGKGIVTDGGDKRGEACYLFCVRETGVFELWSRYASGESRGVDVYIDKKLVKKECLREITGGWTAGFLEWRKEFDIELQEGDHNLEIISSQCVPHIEKFAFFPKGKVPFPPENSRPIPKKDRFGVKNRAIEALVPKNIHNRYLEVLGIYDGRYAYRGPFHVQIDLTHNCNNNCIACWCNSPLLKERRLPAEEKNKYLSLGLVKDLLDELSMMGTAEVYYSGGGEPFMHPQSIEILEYTKRKNLTCHVNTSFTLLDKKKIDCLVDIGVDTLTVSVWAGTSATYARTHPNKTEHDFYKIKENILYLNTHKRERPFTKLYNVLFNMNYFEIKEMVAFAEETACESIEFTLVDTIPGATDTLSLNEKQLVELKALCDSIKANADENNRLKVSGILLFQFDQFLRRISISGDAQEAKYDRNIIDKIPCYIGWLFARVIPNGEVHSCLKAHRIPTGSLYSNTFSEIWNSKKQSYFRGKTRVYKKTDPFFRFIGNDPNTKEAGCHKSCDDIARNTWMHHKINTLRWPQRALIKGIAAGTKLKRRLKLKKENLNDYRSDPILAGVVHGRRAFTGPEQVVIDPTNRCNLQCISCWLYSPFLGEDKPNKDWLKKELSKDVLMKLIDDLAYVHTKKVRFTGGGEPFLHRNLLDIIEYARRKRIGVAVTTNFGVVSKEQIQRLIDLGVEELAISLWASNSETYRKVHPETKAEYFEKIQDNLLYLKKRKNRFLRVTFANVIMNSNYADFEEMHRFGLEYGADAIYFTLADVFSKQTDKLLLTDPDRKRLLDKALRLKERNQNERKIELEFFDGFIRRLSVLPEEFERGLYDKVDVDRIPCYVGWIFSRILADGSVAPCCRGVKKTMGNINKQSFKDIWFSQKYNEFRGRAKYLSKQNDYFKNIGCLKECDNLMHNQQVRRKVLSEGK